ncbi:MAG TPA: hypothetical protein VME67_14960 [Mycobacterium sp.]|nr:hypothetical protein [Mycobacterium sp.]HTX96042.1 hypothetical protein [Mycobacterium sp.]
MSIAGRIVVSAAIAVACGVGRAPPAGADPNPYGTLSSCCGQTAPAGSPVRTDAIDRGIRDGLATGLPEHPGP